MKERRSCNKNAINVKIIKRDRMKGERQRKTEA